MSGAAFVWCPEWYKHPEALIRMEGIWRAWEHLRMEPALGVSTWWLNHADPHMRILMGQRRTIQEVRLRHKSLSAEKTSLPHVLPEVGIFDWREPVGLTTRADAWTVVHQYVLAVGQPLW
ncbi:DUF4913 domain-containing protein [Paenarthrobacter sp. Z7-10]|uniref:DUF4913 domain-containing protein n=1 Tax=Paenarthrobacter sp. Z7-10 TaxID=2787635 RepID=UPI003FA72481|nr:DUF4913 domain-containing protein [Paenarthrobacter sp. Z7-10]